MNPQQNGYPQNPDPQNGYPQNLDPQNPDPNSQPGQVPTPAQLSVQPSEPYEDPNFMRDPAPQPEPAPAPKRRGGKVKKFFMLLLLLLLIAGAAAGAYYYQQQKLDTANAAKHSAEVKAVALQNQFDDSNSSPNTSSSSTPKLPAQLSPKSTATPTLAAPSATQVLNGQVEASDDPDEVVAQTYYVPGQVSEIWLEYGSSTTSFTKATAHVSDGLDQAQGGDYSVHEWRINTDQLQSGSTYYYRSAAKVNGTTVYSAPTAFTLP